MITRLNVDGYRLLDRFDADLGQLTVVIGANATGKSTLLHCLRCIGHCVQMPLQKAIEMQGGVFSIPSAAGQQMQFGWQVEFEEPSTNGTFTRTPRIRKPRSLTYEVKIEGKRTGEVLPLYEVLRTTEPLDNQYESPFKYLEVTRSRAMIYDFRQHNLVPLEDLLSQEDGLGQTPALPGLEPQQDEPEASATPPQEMEQILQLAQMRFPVHKVLGLASRVRLFLANIAFYPGFNVGTWSELRTRPSAIRPETFLWPDGQNLGTVLHEILTRHNYRHSASQLRDFLRAAYPTVTEITAETAYGATPAVLVRVYEEGMHRGMEIWDLSDGMLRFLCLSAALLNPVPSPLIAMDEPEAGLHPRLLPIIADMIKTASEKTQILVTTHSPDLLSNFDLDDVAVMFREGPRAKWYRPGTRKSLHTMLESVQGDTLGDLHRSGELEAMA